MKLYRLNVTILPAFLIFLLSTFCNPPNKQTDMDDKDQNIKAEVIQQLQNETEHFISAWGRTENLFKIDPECAALIIIDMQNFVCAPEEGPGLQGMAKVIENTNRMVDICRERDIPVIWVRHNINTYGDSTDGGLYPVFHNREHIRSVENYGKSTEIYNELHFNKDLDHVVFKNRYSAFLPAPPESELQIKLISLNIKQLIVTGVATNVCVESTVRDAMQLDYEVILISDATTTFDNVIKETTLMNIRLLFGDVRKCQDVIDEILNN